MLQFLRSGLSSFLTMILLGLLVASFALWGIGRDIFSPTAGTVATVGDKKISAQDFAREFQAAYQQQQQQMGGELTRSMAISLGLGQQALMNQVNRLAFIEAARQMGIRVSDEQLRDFIYGLDVFRNDLGEFQKYYFEMAARNQGLEPKAFEELLREDLLRQEFLQALVGPMTLPRPILESIYKFERETRTVDMLVVRASSITDLEAADDDQLRIYYDEHADLYMAPEYRELTYLTIAADSYMDEIAVAEEELRKDYDARRDEFTVQEGRSLRQIVVDDRAAAEEAYQSLQDGTSFAETLAAHSSLSEADAEIGVQTRTDLEETYGPDVAQAVFAAPEGGFTPPQETPFGWYIFQVTEIQGGSATAFEEVRAELERDLKHRRALDKVYDVSNKVEDELAGGMSLDEIAETLNLPLTTTALTDSNGFAPDGAPAGNLPDFDGFLNNAFDAEIGEDPNLHESTGDVFYALSVQNVVPAQMRPFEEVRTAVEQAWTRESRNRKAEELAARLKADVESGKEMKTLAENYPAAAFNRIDLARDDRSGAVSAPIHQAIFDATPGVLALNPASDTDGYVLFQVTARDFPDEIPQDLGQLSENILGIYQSEVLSAYRNYLSAALPIEIHQRTAKAVLDQMTSSEDQ